MEATSRVEEIMIPLSRYPCVRDITPLGEAVSVLEEARIEVRGRQSLPRTLLVFDAIAVMVGYVRRRDIMRGLVPKHLLPKPLEYSRKPFDVEVDFNLSEMSFESVVGGVRAQADRPVSDVMQATDSILEVSDHVLKAVQEMVALDVSMLPVLDDRQLVGVVRSVDVMHLLTQALP